MLLHLLRDSKGLAECSLQEEQVLPVGSGGDSI